MTPTQLRAYVEIVRRGQAKSAAAALGVSEAAISNHVSALRKELDDDLFHRHGSGLTFTPGGLRLASRAVELLGLQDQTRQEVHDANSGRRVLRLAVSNLFAEYAAPGLIELFADRAEDLDVELSVHPPSEFHGLLVSRAADAAIGPVRTQAPTELQVKEFLRYRVLAVASPNHPKARQRLRQKDCANETWLLGPSAVETGGITKPMLDRFGVPESNQRIFPSHAAALAEARRGRGIALALAFRISNDLDDGRLVQLDSPGSQGDGTWAISTLRREQVAPAASELARFISTPRASKAMLSGSGANVARFRPKVHVTLWSGT